MNENREGNPIHRKFEFILPLFFGCLGALCINASLMLRSNAADFQDLSHAAPIEEDIIEMNNVHFFTHDRLVRPDSILERYRDPQTRSLVFDFFTDICASREIADVILYNASQFDISPSLAVALAWEESRLNPRAINTRNRNESIDRGLFQLNDRSFPRLEVQAFFSPETNSWYAMNHLRFCLDTGGSEVAGLAMYNAGTNRVRGAGAPKTTLDYISRIMENRWEIESRFREYVTHFRTQQITPDDPVEIAAAKPERSRLMPLMPLVGK